MHSSRAGLGLRPPLPSGGQGPSFSALALQNQHPGGQPPKQTTLFVGSISGGVTDTTLNALLTACGPIASFKRLITPAGKPQGFGFAEFETADGALLALALLNGIELPALEEGCANKKLLIKSDEKTTAFLNAYASTRPAPTAHSQTAKQLIDAVLEDLSRAAQAALGGEKEKYVIPPHLHDLQEADLPETQRELVVSEIAQFRERAAKKEREKMKELEIQTRSQIAASAAPAAPNRWGAGSSGGAGGGAQAGQRGSDPEPGSRAFGGDAQGYGKPVEFVKGVSSAGTPTQTDEQMEAGRKEARRKEEELSFRDQLRRYEPRERQRLAALERAIARDRAIKSSHAQVKSDMSKRLASYDDDSDTEQSDPYHADRARWRASRARILAQEERDDATDRADEEREKAELEQASEMFLQQQMGGLRRGEEEARKAGMLVDSGGPVKLNVSLAAAAPTTKAAASGDALGFGVDDEEDEALTRKRKGPLVKLDFSAAEAGPEAERQRLEEMRKSVPGKEKDELFQAKIRWDGMSDSLIDRKFEPLVKRLIAKYLGDDEVEELVMFVVEHLKDHKGPNKLAEGLEPVLEEEAIEVATAVWRQLVFESMAYNDGLHTREMIVED